jgi:hypothetical protein
MFASLLSKLMTGGKKRCRHPNRQLPPCTPRLWRGDCWVIQADVESAITRKWIALNRGADSSLTSVGLSLEPS